MDDGDGGQLKQVLSTVGITSQVNEYFATNLTASLEYRF
jgi:hypothetical protein